AARRPGPRHSAQAGPRRRPRHGRPAVPAPAQSSRHVVLTLPVLIRRGLGALHLGAAGFQVAIVLGAASLVRWIAADRRLGFAAALTPVPGRVVVGGFVASARHQAPFGLASAATPPSADVTAGYLERPAATQPVRRRLTARAHGLVPYALYAEAHADALGEGRGPRIEIPAVRQLAVGPLEELREQLRRALAGGPALGEQRDPVLPRGQAEPADTVVVEHPEEVRAGAPLRGMLAAATPVALTALNAEAHLAVAALERGAPHQHAPLARQLPVEVLQELGEQAGGTLAAQKLLVERGDRVVPLAQLEPADAVVVQDVEARAHGDPLAGLRGSAAG